MKAFLVNRFVHLVLLLAVLGGALYVRGQDDPWVRSFRYLAFDTYNRLYPRESNDQVVIADIDEMSLRDDRFGQWPWPRTDVARLVAALRDMGARAIVFDIVFAEEDRTSPSVLLRKNPVFAAMPEVTDALEILPNHDDLLADTFLEAGNVVTGFVWSGSVEATRRAPILSRPAVLGRGMEGFADTIPTAPGVTTNLERLERAAAGNGSFGQHPDVDGIIRRVPLFFSVTAADGRKIVYPSLALEALRVAEDPKNPHKIRALKESELTPLSFPYLLKRGRYAVPLDGDASFHIHFSPYDDSKYISAWKITNGLVPPSKISGKIVLVGTSSIGLKDIRSTPLDLYIPGVDVHRNIIEQVMDGRFLYRPAVMEGAELIFTALVALLAIVLAPFANAVLLGLVTLLLILGVNFFSFWLYVYRGVLVDPVYPSATIFLVFFLASLLSYVRTELERRSVKQAFGLYISEDYMKELTRNPDRLRLGGETRPVTVMFTDIRGFTGISERLEPSALIQLMNDFLTPMSEKVMSHRGTIDKYMGDAMMAFWNAPLDDPDHARNACLAALSMKDALEPVNEAIREQARKAGQEPRILKSGIGINSGIGAVGNMGSRQRFAYSVLGDCVNLASRLEGQTKTYGVDILIGEETRQQVPDFAALELDLLRVKGKDVPVRVHALFGPRKSDSFLALEKVHGAMIDSYKIQDWDEALRLLTTCEEAGFSALSTYYRLMRDRIGQALLFPPSPDWDGVFVAREK